MAKIKKLFSGRKKKVLQKKIKLSEHVALEKKCWKFGCIDLFVDEVLDKCVLWYCCVLYLKVYSDLLKMLLVSIQ